MQNTTKGAIAAAAAAVILAGGAGTLALWSDTETVNAGSITSGTLDLAPVAGSPGTWTDVSPDAVGGPAFDPATDLIVPGDSLQYSRDFAITGTGKNLSAVVEADTQAGLPAGVTTSTTVLVDGAAATQITSADIDEVATVQVTLDFSTTVSGQDLQDTDFDLSALEITLTQVRPA